MGGWVVPWTLHKQPNHLGIRQSPISSSLHVRSLRPQMAHLLHVWGCHVGCCATVVCETTLTAVCLQGFVCCMTHACIGRPQLGAHMAPVRSCTAGTAARRPARKPCKLLPRLATCRACSSPPPQHTLLAPVGSLQRVRSLLACRSTCTHGPPAVRTVHRGEVARVPVLHAAACPSRGCPE